MARPETTGRRLYTRGEFCRAFGIGPTTFHKEVNAGRLVAVRMLGRTMVRDEDAEAWRDALPRIAPKTRNPPGGA